MLTGGLLCAPQVHLAQGFEVTEKTESSGALEQLTLLGVWTSVELLLWVFPSSPCPFPSSVAALQWARSGS